MTSEEIYRALVESGEWHGFHIGGKQIMMDEKKYPLLNSTLCKLIAKCLENDPLPAVPVDRRWLWRWRWNAVMLIDTPQQLQWIKHQWKSISSLRDNIQREWPW